MHLWLGLLVIVLTTKDPDSVHPGDFTEDDVATWAGYALQHRAEIGAEAEMNLHVVLPKVIGIGLLDEQQQFAGIAIARKVGDAVQLGYQRVKVSEDTVRARAIGKSYDLMVSYGLAPDRDEHPPRPHPVEKVKHYRVTLSGEQVFARTSLLADKTTVHLATCVMADVELPPIAGLEVLRFRLDPIGGAPPLPFLIDAATGSSLPGQPDHCVF